MEPVIAHTLVADTGHGRSGDRAAERARLTETRIVNQHKQDIRRAIGRRDMPDQTPVGPRPFQGPVRHTCERRVRDRQPGTVDPVICHGVPALSHVRPGPRARDPQPSKSICLGFT